MVMLKLNESKAVGNYHVLNESKVIGRAWNKRI